LVAPELEPDTTVPWWLRAYLVFGAFQGIALGLTGFVVPEEIQIPYQMSPLNARFIGALYLSAGLGVLLAACVRRRGTTRLFVAGFGIATGLILIVTILHWPEFMSDGLQHRASWIVSYIIDPTLAIAVLLAAHLSPFTGLRPHRSSVFLLVVCAALGLLGLLLLALPQVASAAWPWVLPPTLAQIYGCFFIALSVGAFMGAHETDATAVRNYMLMGVALSLLVLLASALHLPRFKPEPVSGLWFGGFLLASVAFAVEIALGLRRPHDSTAEGRASTVQG
jgi:hypothetical protein